jgi:hypothetical protein
VQVTVTIHQNDDDPQEVIDDPEELRRFVEEQFADAARRGSRPQVTFGGGRLAAGFDVVPGTVQVTP